MSATSARRSLLGAWSAVLALLLATPLYLHALLVEYSHRPDHDGQWTDPGVAIFALTCPLWIVPTVLMAILTTLPGPDAERARTAWTGAALALVTGVVGLVLALQSFAARGTTPQQAHLELVASAVLAGLPLVAMLLSRPRRAHPVRSRGRTLPAPALVRGLLGGVPWFAWISVAALAGAGVLYVLAGEAEYASRPASGETVGDLSGLAVILLLPYWFAPVATVALAATVLRDRDRRRRLEGLCATWTFAMALLCVGIGVASPDLRLGIHSETARILGAAAFCLCVLPWGTLTVLRRRPVGDILGGRPTPRGLR